MSDQEKKKLPELSWSVAKKRNAKSSDFFIILWIFAVTFAIIFYIFSNNVINALVVIAAAGAFSAHYKYSDNEQKNMYRITIKGLRVNNLFYPYSSMKRYRVTKDEDKRDVLIIDMLSVLTPDFVIPLDGVDPDDVDFFLGQFVREDERMPIPMTEILARKFGM